MKGKEDSFLRFFVINEDRGGKGRAGGSRAGEDARPTVCELLSIKEEGLGLRNELGGFVFANCTNADRFPGGRKTGCRRARF